MTPARRHIRDCDRGASVIEMALVAPFLAALLVGIVDVSRAYSERLVLEQAAQRTIEMIEQQHSVSSDYSALESEAESAAGEGSDATVDYWLECDGARQTDFNGACAEGQSYARYVTISIEKTFTPVLGTRFASSNSDGTYTLTADAGIRMQ